jgi:L-fuconolactonase
MRAMAQHPHMFCKLSGMVTEADWNTWTYEQLRPYMEIAAEYFGTGRLCFGSDWPVSLLAADYGKVLEVVLEFLKQVSPEEQRAILSNNTRGFYKL